MGGAVASIETIVKTFVSAVTRRVSRMLLRVACSATEAPLSRDWPRTLSGPQ